MAHRGIKHSASWLPVNDAGPNSPKLLQVRIPPSGDGTSVAIFLTGMSRALQQFVTFRLHDSFPLALRQEWAHMLTIEDNRERRKNLESFLDRGDGRCSLGEPEIADLVQGAFLYFNRKRYELLAWVIMPNHVHVLLKVSASPLPEVIESWKKHTAREANRLLRRRGPFWARDYYDTFMRNAEQQQRAIKYIENNPVKANLVSDSKIWPWSSAEFRNRFGRLCLPDNVTGV